MVVRSKPDVLKQPESLEKFRNADPELVTTRKDGRDARISKTVRMRLRFSEMLRDESYRRSVESGEKVSEADLIDEALMEWHRKYKILAD